MKFLKQIKENKKLAFLFVIVIFAGILFVLVPHFTYAVSAWDWITDPVGSLLQTICDFIDNLGMGLISFGQMILGLSLWITLSLIKSAVNNSSFLVGVNEARDAALSLFGILLIVVSFTQVLHYQTDKWGAKAILPKMFLASFLMIFSLFICEVVIDVGDLATVAVNGHAISSISDYGFTQIFRIYNNGTGKITNKWHDQATRF